MFIWVNIFSARRDPGRVQARSRLAKKMFSHVNECDVLLDLCLFVPFFPEFFDLLISLGQQGLIISSLRDKKGISLMLYMVKLYKAGSRLSDFHGETEKCLGNFLPMTNP